MNDGIDRHSLSAGLCETYKFVKAQSEGLLLHLYSQSSIYVLVPIDPSSSGCCWRCVGHRVFSLDILDIRGFYGVAAQTLKDLFSGFHFHFH